MRKKNLIAIFISIALLLSVGGCGTTSQTGSSTPPETSSSATEQQESSKEENSKAETTSDGDVKKPENFPKKEITLIVPFAAGGAFDVMARTMQPVMKEQYDVNLIVKNVPGAGSAVGITECLTSKPDGYTLAIGSTSFLGLIAQGRMQAKVEDGTYLCTVSEDPMVLVTKAGGKYDTIEAYIEAARANPGTITLGNPGTNNTNQALSVFLDDALGHGTLALTPFSDGAARVATEIIGGHCDGGVVKPNDCMGQIKSGELKPVASFTKERLPDYPDVPTFEELGLDIFPYGDVARTVTFIMSPAGIDPEIKDYLTEIFSGTIESDKFQALAKEGAFSTPGIRGQELESFVNELYAGAEILADKVFSAS